MEKIKSQQKQNLEANKISSSSSMFSSRLGELASAFYLTDQCYFALQQHHNRHHQQDSDQTGTVSTTCSELYKAAAASPPLSKPISGDSFSLNFSEQDTLESLVNPHLLSNNSRDRSIKVTDTSSGSNFTGKNGINPISSGSNNPKIINLSLSFSEKKQSSGQVLLNKKRIKWTEDLHERFVQCVNRLGGAEKATPKAILKLMKSKEVSITQLKSHLQKYRSEKFKANSQSLEGKSEERVCTSDIPQLYMKARMQIRETHQLQLQLEKHLHEQLEIQQNLQILIQEQGKKVKIMMEKQQKSNKNNFETN